MVACPRLRNLEPPGKIVRFLLGVLGEEGCSLPESRGRGGSPRGVRCRLGSRPSTLVPECLFYVQFPGKPTEISLNLPNVSCWHVCNYTISKMIRVIPGGWGCLRGWWGDPWRFEFPLRHHLNNQRGIWPRAGFPFSAFMARVDKM